jgi:hypothetical protein
MTTPFSPLAKARTTAHATWRRLRWSWAQGQRALRQSHPDFWRQVLQELTLGRHWVDRTVMLGFAVLTGAVVVGFTLLAEGAIQAFRAIESGHPC